ncbi:MAG: hypothetical protein HYZ75_08015 [Elusimicrobia bacterium]|nr:hypothetical protein [Elusimicrobiota bacterium]
MRKAVPATSEAPARSPFAAAPAAPSTGPEYLVGALAGAAMAAACISALFVVGRARLAPMAPAAARAPEAALPHPQDAGLIPFELPRTSPQKLAAPAPRLRSTAPADTVSFNDGPPLVEDLLSRPSLRPRSARAGLLWMGNAAAPARAERIEAARRAANGEADGAVNDRALADPLVFDLSGAGVRTTNLLTRFDVRGDGRPVAIHELASGTAALVFDADGDGKAGKSGRELFGFDSRIRGGRSETYRDGFQALEAFLLRAEEQGVLATGRLAGRRLDRADLERLHRRYGLAFRVGGWAKKVLSPKEAGVSEIFLADGTTHRVLNFDGQGNDVLRREGARFIRADGSTGSYEDVFYAHEESRLLAARAQIP